MNGVYNYKRHISNICSRCLNISFHKSKYLNFARLQARKSRWPAALSLSVKEIIHNIMNCFFFYWVTQYKIKSVLLHVIIIFVWMKVYRKTWMNRKILNVVDFVTSCLKFFSVRLFKNKFPREVRMNAKCLWRHILMTSRDFPPPSPRVFWSTLICRRAVRLVYGPILRSFSNLSSLIIEVPVMEFLIQVTGNGWNTSPPCHHLAEVWKSCCEFHQAPFFGGSKTV